MRVTTVTLVLGMLAPGRASAQGEARRAEVLVLGVFHLANPGHDIVNSQVDDVLAPKRQQEIAELATALARFKPTKVAVENDAQRALNERYARYRAGQYVLSANETDQIGLRLAKMLGHDSVYAVDADGEFPWPRLVKYAKATGQQAQFDAHVGEIGVMVKQQNEYLKSHSILQTMLYVNSDSSVARAVGFYFQEARYGEPWDYAGPDLVAEWYRRNLRIFNNVARLAAPGERILVIFGAGHLGWLRQIFAGDPGIRVRTLAEFAP